MNNSIRILSLHSLTLHEKVLFLLTAIGILLQFLTFQKTRHTRREEPKGGSILCLDHQACLSCRVEMVIEVVCFPMEIL